MPERETFEFESEIWLYNGTWHFATVPVEPSEEIRLLTSGLRRGFGSVRVEVKIGTTVWRTSVFPEAKAGTYFLPIKAEVRKREELGVGDRARIAITLVDD